MGVHCSEGEQWRPVQRDGILFRKSLRFQSNFISELLPGWKTTELFVLQFRLNVSNILETEHLGCDGIETQPGKEEIEWTERDTLNRWWDGFCRGKQSIRELCRYREVSCHLLQVNTSHQPLYPPECNKHTDRANRSGVVADKFGAFTRQTEPFESDLSDNGIALRFDKWPASTYSLEDVLEKWVSIFYETASSSRSTSSHKLGSQELFLVVKSLHLFHVMELSLGQRGEGGNAVRLTSSSIVAKEHQRHEKQSRAIKGWLLSAPFRSYARCLLSSPHSLSFIIQRR